MREVKKEIPIAKTYPEEVWENQKLKSWSKPLHHFGIAQNALNQALMQQILLLEQKNDALTPQLNKQEAVIQKVQERILEREKEMYGRLGAELDTMQAEINRIRLATQLNSNTLDRLVKGTAAEQEPEPAAALPDAVPEE